MRRALASLLLALLSFPLIAAVVLADTSSDLPACCRRDGKHHCAMAAMGEPDMGPAFRTVQVRCPLFPKPSVVSAFSSPIVLATVSRNGDLPVLGLNVTVRDDVHRQVAFEASVHKRGPPSHF